MTQPPENCKECRVLFFQRPALQEEVGHEVMVRGIGAGIFLLRERLESEHEEHLDLRLDE